MPAAPFRFYLVHAPAAAIETIDRAVRRPAERDRLARELAHQGLRHQRAAAASERVAGDVRKRAIARSNERFAFAAGNLPYFVAAADPHGVAEALEEIRGLQSDAALESFFVAQAEALGLRVRQLDPAIAAPPPDVFESWVRERLERIAASAPPRGLRRLFGAGTPPADGALAELLGRIGPTWSEGRGRWLGTLIRPAPDAAHDERLIAGLPVDPAEIRAVYGMPDPAAPVAESLRAVLEGEPLLAPAVRAGPETTLVRRHESLGRILTERWHELALHAARWFLSQALEDWRRLLLAALHVAHRSGEPLLEAPDVFRYGYRWPPL